MDKRIIFGVIALLVVFIAVRKCGGHKYNETPITNYTGIVQGVENGNTLVLSSGLRVELLGVSSGHTATDQWIRNNVFNRPVTLVADSKNEQTFRRPDEHIRAYANLREGDVVKCINRKILEDNPQAYSLAFISDSSFIGTGQPGPDVRINDPGLYMKQRSLMVETADGSIGTAFFINNAGVAITNNHVLNGQQPACVYLYADGVDDAKVYSSKRRNIKNIIYTNPALDITIFSVDLELDDQINSFNLAKQHTPVGSTCHIFGNPQGLTASYGRGVISAYRDDDQVPGRQLVQYDVSTNGGNSGGPVMNDRGEIIAVHSMGMKQASNGSAAQGLNFGVDILQVRGILDDPAYNVNYGGKL